MKLEQKEENTKVQKKNITNIINLVHVVPANI